MSKQGIEFGITLLLVVVAVIAIKFVGIWTSITALAAYTLGRFVGRHLTEPKIVEKIVESPAKPKKIKSTKTK